MNLKRTRIFLIFVLLVAMMIFPVAGTEADVTNGTMNATTPVLTETPGTTGITLENESGNVSPGQTMAAGNCTEYADGTNCTVSGNATESSYVHPAARNLAKAMAYTTLSTGPWDAQSYDHYVMFTMRADSLAPNYAYDLVNRGEPSDGSQWVYNMYMFGTQSSGMDGRLAVYDNARHQISPLSVPLSPGTDYTITWRYNNIGGGELFVNGASQGTATGDGSLANSLSSSFHVGENMYTGDGREHSPFNGNIWDVYHYEKDLDQPEVPTYSMTNTFSQYAGKDNCDNMSKALKKIGWGEPVNYKSMDLVTKGDFGLNTHPAEKSLNDATLHYHVGHGLVPSGEWKDISGLGLLDKPENYLSPAEVEGIWGNKNKWVILHSCYALVDNRWGKALSTSHGVLGFKTSVYINPEFTDRFFHYAIDEKKTIYSAYRLTTYDLYRDDPIPTKMTDGKPDYNGNREIPVAAVIFGNDTQAYGDHLPGISSGVTPDVSPDVLFKDDWPCDEVPR